MNINYDNKGRHEKIRPFVQDMIKALVVDKPDDVPLYMVCWLRKYAGLTSTGLTVQERTELERLRMDVKYYRQLHEIKAKTKMKINTVNSQLNGVSLNISDIDFNNDKYTYSDGDDDNHDNDNDDIDPSLDDVNAIQQRVSSKPRYGVSCEVIGEYNPMSFTPSSILKTHQQSLFIKTHLLNTFLFNTLPCSDMQTMINAMEYKTFKANETIIAEGDYGNSFYLVESGVLRSLRNDVKVKEYVQGDIFGEVALLYNMKMQMTVKAVSDGGLWVLSRECFVHVVGDAARKRRELHESILKKVEVFNVIEEYELMQVAEALKSLTFYKGDYIVKEGEMGDVFYIIYEGECNATKLIKNKETIMKKYTYGNYFGERALVKGEPRYENIIACTEIVRVFTLDRESFNRLLGPIEEILKRNIEKYQI